MFVRVCVYRACVYICGLEAGIRKVCRCHCIASTGGFRSQAPVRVRALRMRTILQTERATCVLAGKKQVSVAFFFFDVVVATFGDLKRTVVCCSLPPPADGI